MLATEQRRTIVESQVEAGEGRAKAAEEALARERAEMQAKLIEEKNSIINLAINRIWLMNQDIDISFIGFKQTEILSKWKARLAEEEFLASVTASGATTSTLR